MQARRGDDISTISPNIDARAKYILVTDDMASVIGILKVEMPSSSSAQSFECLREWTMTGLEGRESVRSTTVRIYIDGDESRFFAGAYSDVGLWPFVPPVTNGSFIRRGVLEAMSGTRVFARVTVALPTGTPLCCGCMAGEDGPALAGIGQSRG
jgi:hypothetical protein